MGESSVEVCELLFGSGFKAIHEDTKYPKYRKYTKYEKKEREQATLPDLETLTLSYTEDLELYPWKNPPATAGDTDVATLGCGVQGRPGRCALGSAFVDPPWLWSRTA